MLIGYGRVSTADQNPDHQVDALMRAGVTPDNIYIDHASGAKASRPELDKALASANRDGDADAEHSTGIAWQTSLHSATQYRHCVGDFSTF